MRRTAKATKKQLATLVKLRLQFTDAEMKAVQAAAGAVWFAIGYDAITSIAEAEGKNPNTYTMSREEVLELVCDAGRLEEEIADPGLRARVRDLGIDVYELVRPEFPEARFGL